MLGACGPPATLQVYPATGLNTNLQWCGAGFSQLPAGIGFGGAQGDKNQVHRARGPPQREALPHAPPCCAGPLAGRLQPCMHGPSSTKPTCRRCTHRAAASHSRARPDGFMQRGCSEAGLLYQRACAQACMCAPACVRVRRASLRCTSSPRWTPASRGRTSPPSRRPAWPASSASRCATRPSARTPTTRLLGMWWLMSVHRVGIGGRLGTWRISRWQVTCKCRTTLPSACCANHHPAYRPLHPLRCAL